MRIKFKNLMLEVTRKCNMHCAHCMRGEQQDETMSTDTIQRLLEHVGEIEQLSITGGEPSLAPEPIHWLAYFAKSRGIKIGSFFCATNAGEYSKEFVDALSELCAVCTEPNKCILAISIDQFHDEADPKALSEYRSLPYYSLKRKKAFYPKAKYSLKAELPKTILVDSQSLSQNTFTISICTVGICILATESISTHSAMCFSIPTSVILIK